MDKNSSSASEGRPGLCTMKSEVSVKILSKGRPSFRNIPGRHACGCLVWVTVLGILVVIRELDAVEGFGGSGGKHSKGRAVCPCG